MTAFERQIQNIADKDALHKWIDNLSDDAVVLILSTRTNAAENEDPENRFNTLGHPRSDTLIWLIEAFKFWFFHGDDE